MRRHSLPALLMLTMACGLAAAADPPAKPEATLPAALAEGIKIKLPEGINVETTDPRIFNFSVGFERGATDSKPKSTSPATKPVRKPTAASDDPFAPTATGHPTRRAPDPFATNQVGNKATGYPPTRRSADPVPTNQIVRPPTVRYRATKTKTVVVKPAKVADPGYTQYGRLYKLKLDRPKTQLSLYEGSIYGVYAESHDVRLIGAPDDRLIELDDADVDGNGITFRAVRPGVMTFVLIDKETEKKKYVVEITILADTRQLQSQLDKLYPQASIQAIKVRESVLLRGTVATAESIEEIVEIAEQFYPTVLNQLEIAAAPARRPQPRVIPNPYAPTRSSNDKTTPRNSKVISSEWPIPYTRVAPSQTKATGKQVGQPQYAQPRPTPIGLPGPPHIPRSSPPQLTRHSIALAKTNKRQIIVQAVVLEFDWKKLKEADINLAETVKAFETYRTPILVSDEQPKFITKAIPHRAADGMVRLLKATKAVRILSQPQIVMMEGRPAEIVVGGEIDIVTRKEIRNGRSIIKGTYRHIGTKLKLTPQLVSNGWIKLTVVLEHTQQVGMTAARIAG